MKLKFSLGLIGALCAGSAAAHESGFYTGVGASFSNAQAQTNVHATTEGGGFNSLNFNIQKTSWNADFFGGYQKYFGSNFFAGEAFLDPFQDTVKKTSIGAYTNFADGDILFQDIELRTLRKFSLGARFKYGRHFDAKTAAFVSLGLLGSRFKVRHGDSSPETVNYQTFLFGYAPGAGVKYYLKPHMPISFSYEYQIYNQLTTKNMTSPAISPGDNIQYKIKNRYHNFMISISCEL